MAPQTINHNKPAIVMTRSEHARLWGLAETFSARNAALAEKLFAELDRADIVPDGEIGGDVVRMGSTLRFAADTGDDKTVTLVFPGDADISTGKVSILTPIGTALIGLSVGQSIEWAARDGSTHRLTIESVEQPADASVPAEPMRRRAL